VAKGYSQTYDIDYDETFAPVVKMSIVRTLILMAVNGRSKLHQLDVKNTFLHEDLIEEVYMEFPTGFGTAQTVGKVCRLKKSLYGSKQSPRACFDRFRKVMISLGYQQINADHTVFSRQHCGHITILVVYVNNMIIIGDDEGGIAQLNARLEKKFEVTETYMLGCWLTISPIDVNAKISADAGE
jgi:Reverse transcriptase (RNA-dependent DNA polymerase)